MPYKILICAFSIFFVIGYASAEEIATTSAEPNTWLPPPPPPEAVTKEGGIKKEFWGSGKPSPLCDTNARPEIYRILDSPTSGTQGEVMCLGISGETEDVAKITRWIEKHKDTKITDLEERKISHLIIVLWRLDQRGIVEAGLVLDKMIDPKYWNALNFSCNGHKSGDPEMFFSYVRSALLAKAWSTDERFEEKARKVAEGIQDTKNRSIYIDILQGYMKDGKKFKAAKAAGNWNLYWAEFKAKREAEALEMGKQEAELRKSIRRDRVAYMNLFEKYRYWLVDNPDFKSEQHKELIAEAQAAFPAILDMLANNKDADLVSHSVTLGRPALTAKERTPELQKQLLEEEGMPEWLARSHAVGADFKVLSQGKEIEKARIHFFTFPKPDKTDIAVTQDDLKDPKKNVDLIVVTVQYKDMRDLCRKHPKNFQEFNQRIIPTCTEKLDPIVAMVWEGGEWYWVPFGM